LAFFLCVYVLRTDPRTFDLTISASQLTQGLLDVNARFGLSLPTAAEDWAVMHVNLELEATQVPSPVPAVSTKE
jgi:hypothetical protein